MQHARVRHTDLLGDVGERAVRRSLVAEDLDSCFQDVGALLPGGRACARRILCGHGIPL
jgi:hypothetical protein